MIQVFATIRMLFEVVLEDSLQSPPVAVTLDEPVLVGTNTIVVAVATLMTERRVDASGHGKCGLTNFDKLVSRKPRGGLFGSRVVISVEDFVDRYRLEGYALFRVIVVVVVLMLVVVIWATTVGMSVVGLLLSRRRLFGMVVAAAVRRFSSGLFRDSFCFCGASLVSFAASGVCCSSYLLGAIAAMVIVGTKRRTLAAIAVVDVHTLFICSQRG